MDQMGETFRGNGALQSGGNLAERECLKVSDMLQP